jgi:C-terminal processing protease CtpA/Prc
LQIKISSAESLKKDFDDSCKREKDLRLEIAKLQAEYEAAKQKAADKERLKKDLDDSCNRERDLKLEIAKLQAEYEAVKQKASDKESAGYKLLDAISGHVAERKGIGMVVRIDSSKPNGEYQVKQLIPGGSASKSPIKVGDIITEVDSNPISKLPIEQVQNLILGPEGTTVTITGIANGKRYSETLVRGEAHHTRPFEIEAKEAIDAFNNKHHQAQEAIESKKKIEDLLAAARIEISELEKAKERGLRSAEQAASLAKQLEQSNGQIAKLETDLTKERSLVTKLSADLNAAQKDSLKLKQEMQNSTQVLRAEISHLKSKLESSEKETSSLMKRCKELEQINGQIAKLEMDLTKERSLVTKLSSELKAAQEDALKLKAEMQKSIQVFRAEISHLKSKLESSEKEVSSLIKKCKENESLGAKMAEALEALYATTEALRGQNMQQCGVGMIVKVDDRGDTCSVTSLTPGGPASASGVLECGDTLLTINGQDIRGMTCALVQEQVMGPAGTIISLTGTHINSEPFSVELVRGAHVGNHRSQSVDEMTQGNIATAKGLHKEIARLSRVYAEAQQQVQTLKSEADYAERREEALRLSLRGIEQEHVSTSGSLQTRMREIELVENELHECQMRLAAAEAKSRNETVRCDEYENANARLGKQISDLTIELEKQQSLTMTLDKQVGAKKIETKILSDQLETIQNEKQHLEIRIQTLYAQLRDLENQNEVSQRKLVLAASARLELEEIRRMQHEELTVLKESSISALGSLADAERDMSTLKRNVAETHAEYVKQVNNYQAQLAKEREMTTVIEQQLEIAKVKVASCRRLLDVMSGYEVQRAGVGILVRTHPQVTGFFSVKELFEGGSAAHSEKIKIGDTLLEVDGIAVKGMPIDSVQNLIVGPVGSAVTIKCHSDGGVATTGDSEPNRNSDLFVSTENLFALFANRTIRSSIDPDKGYFYTVTLIRGEIWAQKDNLLHQTETACDRVRALLAEHIEAKKIIQSLMLDMNTRQRMLVQARSELQQVCERVNIPLEEEPSCEAASLYREDPFWKNQTLTFSDDSCIISFDRTQTEIVASRLRATNVLSDLMKMAELGLQSYQVQRCSLEDKAQTLMTAEARITHQSENINDLQEKLANTNTTLNQALSESHVRLADLKILEKVTSELRTEKNEKTQAIVDLKQELANALEQKQASISNCNELSKKVGLLDIQLKEAEMIVAQRGEAISHIQVCSDMSNFVQHCSPWRVEWPENFVLRFVAYGY